MKKSNKALSIVISIIYAAVAVEWIISIVSQYLKIKGGFSPVAEILYFVPAVLMLIIAGLEIYRLVKGKYKVLDSVLFLILPFNPSHGDSFTSCMTPVETSTTPEWNTQFLFIW